MADHGCLASCCCAALVFLPVPFRPLDVSRVKDSVISQNVVPSSFAVIYMCCWWCSMNLSSLFGLFIRVCPERASFEIACAWVAITSVPSLGRSQNWPGLQGCVNGIAFADMGFCRLTTGYWSCEQYEQTTCAGWKVLPSCYIHPPWVANPGTCKLHLNMLQCLPPVQATQGLKT